MKVYRFDDEVVIVAREIPSLPTFLGKIHVEHCSLLPTDPEVKAGLIFIILAKQEKGGLKLKM